MGQGLYGWRAAPRAWLGLWWLSWGCAQLLHLQLLHLQRGFSTCCPRFHCSRALAQAVYRVLRGKKVETFETRRWLAPGAEKGRGHSQAKHVNTVKTRFARSGVGVGRSGAWRQPSALTGACSRARDLPAHPGSCSAAAPAGVQGETPAETRGSGLASSAGRAAGGKSGGGGFLRISRAGGKPL